MPPSVDRAAFPRALLAGLIAVLVQPGVRAQSSETQDAAAGAPPAKVRFQFENRPTLTIGDWIQIRLRTKLQGDVRGELHALDVEETDFDLARRRVGVQGELFGRLSFEVERDVAGPWRNVYADIKVLKPVQVQVGRFKMPFSAEQLTSIVDLPFVDRSMAANNLAPGRDTGMMIHGKVGGRRFGYQIGLFRQDGDTARRGKLMGSDQTVAGRLTTSLGLKPLTLGANATTGEVPEGLNGLPGRTVNGFKFFERVYVKGRRLRLGADAGWHADRYRIDAEWMQLRDERLGQGLGDLDLPDAVASGWHLSGTWLVREGRRPTSRRHAFFERGFGDLEAAARVEAVAFGSAGGGDTPFRQPRAAHLFDSRVHATTLGINWYVNRWVKMLNDLTFETFSDPQRRPRADEDHEWRWAIRLQWAM